MPVVISNSSSSSSLCNEHHGHDQCIEIQILLLLSFLRIFLLSLSFFSSSPPSLFILSFVLFAVDDNFENVIQPLNVLRFTFYQARASATRLT